MTILAIALAYILGSVPTGLWLGLRFRKVDIRQYGSRNIGATNTLRVLGKPLGIAALIGDAGKGALAVLLAHQLSDWQHAPLACALAVIGGHTASIFLKFKGGKGVATSAGAFLALIPVPTLVAVATFMIVVASTRMVSAGSISAAALMVGAMWFSVEPFPVRAVVAAVGIVVIVRHRSNMGRILAGTESRLSDDEQVASGDTDDTEDSAE